MAGELTFSPDTLVRFRSGRMLIHTTSAALPAFETENAMLIGWLCQFAKPFNPEALVANVAGARTHNEVQSPLVSMALRSLNGSTRCILRT